MIKKTALVVSLLLSSNMLMSQPSEGRGDRYIPMSSGDVVEHSYYSLEYSEEHEQAAWVYYLLTKENISAKVKRSNNFRTDPKVATKSSELVDYRGSGYDRGHLCPAGSMSQNKTAMSESFFLSNMSPQAPSFNRGIWKSLESRVRKWVAQEDSLYVVTGPIFQEPIGTIGINGVTIPSSYFKVIYDPTGERRMTAFIMPNRKCVEPLEHFVTTVDEIERLTGTDFFSQLPDQIENSLESKTVLF